MILFINSVKHLKDSLFSDIDNSRCLLVPFNMTTGICNSIGLKERQEIPVSWRLADYNSSLQEEINT